MNLGVPVHTYKNKTIGYYGGKFLPFHKGHLECIMKASQQVDVLFVVIGYDDEYDKSLCENTKFKWVSNRVRERWISKELKEFPNIRVLSQYEKRSDDYMNDESVVKSNLELLEKVGGRIDICFSSEPEYEEYFNKVQPKSKHVILDAERSGVNISATKIRELGVYKSWDYLPKVVQEHYVKRVCICGVESVGKSVLVKKLASMYGTNYVNEYGREFYEEINNCHDVIEYTDLIKIAYGHNYLIEEVSKKSNKVLFVDTDNIYTQFFVAEYYGKLDNTIESIINSNSDEIDLYIYIEPTLPHELDGMRQEKSMEMKYEENEFLKELYKRYGKELKIIDSPNNLDEIKSLVDELIS